MTLYKKAFIAVLLTLFALFALLYTAAHLILMRSFEQIEARGVATNIQRVCSALDDDINSLKSIALGWSKWDDVYHFVDDINQNFITNNLNDPTFVDSNLNLMVFLNKRQEIVYAKAFDLEANKEVPLPESLRAHLKPGDPLITHTDITSVHQGFLSLPEGYLMTVSLPLLTSLAEGPINGTVIWGRFLDQAQVNHLSDVLRLKVSLIPFDQTILNDAELIDPNLIQPPMPDVSFYMTPISDTEALGDTVISDVYGNPIALLHLRLARTVYSQGQTTLSYFLAAVVLIGLVFGAVTIYELERNVLRRLRVLSTQVTHIRNTGNLKTPLNVIGSDELATLGVGLESMLDALDESRMKLQAANAQLKEANDNLEQRVTARTADLTDAIELLRLEVAERRQAEELLAQARDQALEALRMKTQILSNVSHDARTPLTTIMLHSELLQRGTYGAVTDKQAQRLESILVSARQLLGFINNLLGEAQLSSGNLRLHMAPLSPAQLIREISLVVVPLAERKELKMTLEVDASVPAQIVSDSDRLKQIITNLCDNAIKFTASGQISVNLTKMDATHLLLTVKDTGRGIPKEALERIFDAFWQVDGSSTRDVNRGVGLGLSIVKQLVTAMNGMITVESELGKGTTFTIQLPMLLTESEIAPTSVA
ncbi:MAG: HAMP domain-containing protein [Anaerolineae bacterium]|nr:HAMP domain-containing protein [Anaerolineae bacterium]